MTKLERYRQLCEKLDELQKKSDAIKVVDEETEREKRRISKEYAKTYVEIVKMNIEFGYGCIDHAAE
jgi:hypothetical protein